MLQKSKSKRYFTNLKYGDQAKLFKKIWINSYVCENVAFENYPQKCTNKSLEYILTENVMYIFLHCIGNPRIYMTFFESTNKRLV